MIDFSNLQIDSVLNLGAGRAFEPHGIWIDLFKAKKKVAIEADYKKVETWINTEWIPLQLEIENSLPFPQKSFDIIIGTDFLEHLKTFGDVSKLLYDCEWVAKKAIIWFTPVGFLDTEKYQLEHVKSYLDVHHLGLQVEDFDSCGYEVEIIKNLHNFGDVHFDAMWAWKIL